MPKNYGIKSSRDGQDVLNFVLERGSVTSQYSTPKVKPNQSPAHVDVVTYTWGSDPGNGTQTLITRAHGYSYTPMVWAMFKHTVHTGNNWLFLPAQYGSMSTDLFYGYTDGTNFHVKLKRTSGGAGNLNGATITVKYMIFAEDGS